LGTLGDGAVVTLLVDVVVVRQSVRGLSFRVVSAMVIVAFSDLLLSFRMTVWLCSVTAESFIVVVHPRGDSHSGLFRLCSLLLVHGVHWCLQAADQCCCCGRWDEPLSAVILPRSNDVSDDLGNIMSYG
jgi:hypothetical protein